MKKSAAQASRNLPKLSILIPVRNRERTIKACLDSLAGIDYPDCEVLVYDDNSTDNTWKLLEQYTLKGMRSLRGLAEPNASAGMGPALELLVRQSRGELLLFLDPGLIIKDAQIVKRAVGVLLTEELGSLALLPGQQLMNWQMQLYVPNVLYWMSCNYIPAELSLRPGLPDPADGKFTLYRRNVFQQVQKEGFGLDTGFTSAAYFELHGLKSDLYSNNRAAFMGLSGELVRIYQGKVLLQLLFILVLILATVAPFVLLPFDIRALLPIGLLLAGKYVYCLYSGQPVLLTLLFTPFQAVALILLQIHAFLSGLLKKPAWKEKLAD